ncbi:MAG: Mov34/MPN/PAD-1 family protein [Thermoplasmata archaeon]|nr:Mov34/MPN/PAD-1 family protein [Thermoplasmata archaeon]
MSIFRKRRHQPPAKHITAIRSGVLETILASARSTHPHEFAGSLRAEGDTITEVILIPGTISGDSHAIMKTYMLPIDLSIVGSVHSHPSPSPYPSEADLQMFKNFGRVHIIAAYPYTMDSWRSYDSTGREIHLEVV